MKKTLTAKDAKDAKEKQERGKANWDKSSVITHGSVQTTFTVMDHQSMNGFNSKMFFCSSFASFASFAVNMYLVLSQYHTATPNKLAWNLSSSA